MAWKPFGYTLLILSSVTVAIGGPPEKPWFDPPLFHETSLFVTV
jgi:hypothetical protein